MRSWNAVDVEGQMSETGRKVSKQKKKHKKKKQKKTKKESKRRETRGPRWAM